jgi:hypothetical protein
MGKRKVTKQQIQAAETIRPGGQVIVPKTVWVEQTSTDTP